MCADDAEAWPAEGEVKRARVVRKEKHAMQSDPRFVASVDPAGNLTIRTTDNDPYFATDRAREETEIQAALDSFRARHDPPRHVHLR